MNNYLSTVLQTWRNCELVSDKFNVVEICIRVNYALKWISKLYNYVVLADPTYGLDHKRKYGVIRSSQNYLFRFCISYCYQY
jgi:hypothetical protein